MALVSQHRREEVEVPIKQLGRPLTQNPQRLTGAELHARLLGADAREHFVNQLMVVFHSVR